MSCTATYTCGFTSAQKQCISRSLKGRICTCTHTHSSFVPPLRCVLCELCQTGSLFILKAEGNDGSHIKSMPFTYQSAANAERAINTTSVTVFTHMKSLKLRMQFHHFVNLQGFFVQIVTIFSISLNNVVLVRLSS